MDHSLSPNSRLEPKPSIIYYYSTGVGAPEVEGTLWLKAESKKSWKRFHFVLRTSGKRTKYLSYESKVL